MLASGKTEVGSRQIVMHPTFKMETPDYSGFFEKGNRRVLVVDDQRSVSELVCVFLNGKRGYAIAAEAATGREGLRQFRRHQPDLVITGLALPELSGPELIRAIREDGHPAKIFVYTGTRNPELILAGLDADPDGFVHKTESLQLFNQGLESVAQGIRFLSSHASDALEKRRRAATATGRLTPQERTVLQLVAEGKNTKQIATALALSIKSVERYRLQIMKKLGLGNVASVTAYAIRCGLLEV